MDRGKWRRKGAVGPLARRGDERHRGTLSFFACAWGLDDEASGPPRRGVEDRQRRTRVGGRGARVEGRVGKKIVAQE